MSWTTSTWPWGHLKMPQRRQRSVQRASRSGGWHATARQRQGVRLHNSNVLSGGPARLRQPPRLERHIAKRTGSQASPAVALAAPLASCSARAAMCVVPPLAQVRHACCVPGRVALHDRWTHSFLCVPGWQRVAPSDVAPAGLNLHRRAPCAGVRVVQQRGVPHAGLCHLPALLLLQVLPAAPGAGH